MKNIRASLGVIAIIALPTSVVLLTSGCASTATSESTGEYIDDSAITAKVKTALLSDKTVSGMAVKVVTFKGVVQLSGFVDSETERQQAEMLASAVSGVKSVENKITVKAGS
jgi:osmotically-inducible protein OsmY